MELTKENLQEWKAELDRIMFTKYEVENYSQCKTDDEWLEDYLDRQPEDAESDEVQYWDEL